MIDWAFVIAGVSVGLNVLLWTRVRYWHRRYRQLMDDAFERGCRAVVTEDANPRAQIAYKRFKKL
jgi:hypothetical protein